VLLKLGLASELRGNDDRRKMVIVASEIRYLDLRVGYALLYQPFYLRCVYGHCADRPRHS